LVEVLKEVRGRPQYIVADALGWKDGAMPIPKISNQKLNLQRP
jgi:hypothetical protein